MNDQTSFITYIIEEADRRLEANEAAVTGALLKCAFRLDWNIHDYAAALDAAFETLQHGQSATVALMVGADAVRKRRARPRLIGFDLEAGPDMSAQLRQPGGLRLELPQ